LINSSTADILDIFKGYVIQTNKLQNMTNNRTQCKGVHTSCLFGNGVDILRGGPITSGPWQHTYYWPIWENLHWHWHSSCTDWVTLILVSCFINWFIIC